jgi:ATP-dependent DNA helicase RecQ
VPDLPDCPTCSTPMTLRTAKFGKNAGGRFWGCSDYPKCKGTRDVESVGAAPAAAASARAAGTAPAAHAAPDDDIGMAPRVVWADGTIDRPGWLAEHLPVGGGWRGFAMKNEHARRSAATWVAWSDLPSYEPADQDSRRVCGLTRKLLQRGTHAPVSPDVERTLLDAAGVQQAPRTGSDLAPRLEPGAAQSFLAQVFPPSPASDVGSDLRYDSDEEEQFHRSWVPRELGPTAARWFVPQASLGALLRGLDSHDPDLGDARRVDFLASHPCGSPFVIEIDGLQHASSTAVDADRDAALRSVGVDVLRIPAAEVRAGRGAGLDAVAARWRDIPDEVAERHTSQVPAQLNRIALGLLTAVEQGFLAGDRWVVELVEDMELDLELLVPHLDLLAAVDELWGPAVSPSAIWVIAGAQASRVDRVGLTCAVAKVDQTEVPPVDVRLAVEAARTPVDPLPPRLESPAVVVRPSVLPVEVRLKAWGATARVAVRTDTAATDAALMTALRFLFAKESFREGQRESLLELLTGRDTVVLLPTGGGKSLVYQLAGLLLPGATLVIDPIVALLEDQIRGLRAHGIDRALGISSYITAQGRGDEALARVATGDALFVFVAPERLQMPAFRTALRTMVASTMVNVAVVDEAHCVSEWGHDFRTSYLRLGEVIRRTCADARGNPPPILALTGTASRAVLRDVLFELGIDPAASPNTIIRPATFDRAELSFHVSRGGPSDAEARLVGEVQALPQRAGKPQATYFAPRGHDTNSGIIFAVHVNGAFGITRAADALLPVIGARAALYSGSTAPKPGPVGKGWEHQKRRNAEAFVSNESVALAATKSFGMGIDKPNIRWVVHYSMPLSIEAYYQEAGRAGRDGRRADCVLVFTEFDEARADRLLDPDRDLEEIRAEASGVKKHSADDVTRALWFMTNSFVGVDAELEVLGRVIDDLAQLGALGTVNATELPFASGQDDKAARERVLHRLVVLGILRDYTVDWGRKLFGVDSLSADASSVAQSLLDFVGRTQPARASAMRQRVDAAGWTTMREAALGCSRELTEFVYDTIERSRRRSMREMWLAARAGDGESLRTRILDYLQEGDAAPILEALLDAGDFDFADWTGALDPVTLPDDVAEWRGNSGRLLVSEPDHPGLLLVRAVTEMRAADGDMQEALVNLRRAVESSQERYDVAEPELVRMATWLAEHATGPRPIDAHTSAVAAICAIAFEDAGRPDLGAGLREASLRNPTHAIAGILQLGNALREIADGAEKLLAAHSS